MFGTHPGIAATAEFETACQKPARGSPPPGGWPEYHQAAFELRKFFLARQHNAAGDSFPVKLYCQVSKKIALKSLLNHPATPIHPDLLFCDIMLARPAYSP